MNRLVFAIAATLTCAGCAASVEDAQPEPEPSEPQRSPPQKPFVGGFYDPYANIVTGVDDIEPDFRIRILQPPRFPDPDPNSER